MSLDFGKGLTIGNVLQTLFASLALSPNKVIDQSDLIRLLNIDVNCPGEPFQFLSMLVVAIKEYGEQFGKPMIYEEIMSTFTGQFRQCQCCMNCRNVFYNRVPFDYIVRCM